MISGESFFTIRKHCQVNGTLSFFSKLAWAIATHTSSATFLACVFFLSRTNGKGVCSILASPLRCMWHVFAWNSDIDLRGCSGVFCEVWVFLRNNFSFLRQNPANYLANILKVSTCSGYIPPYGTTHDSFCLCIKPSSLDLLTFFLVSINL